MYRKTKVLLGILLFVVFFSNEVKAQEFVQANSKESISLFESDIQLQQNTDIYINEKIHYNFPTYKHGIYRYIPLDFKKFKLFEMPTQIKIKGVTYYPENSPNNKNSKYESSREDSNYLLKIGDPDETIIGSYVYDLSYILKYATRVFDDHDELYLNIVGNGWVVDIEKVIANITLPGDVEKSICYTGVYGSQESNCELRTLSNNILQLTTTKPLAKHEGVSVVISMPKGTLEDTTQREKREFILSNMAILLPIPTLLGLLAIIKNKFTNKRRTVVPSFTSPANINAIEAGYLLSSGQINSKFVTAEIIKLATEGFISIERVSDREYIIKKTDSTKQIVEDSSKQLYEALFNNRDSISTKDKDTELYKSMAVVKNTLKDSFEEERIFKKNALTFRMALIIVGFILFMVSFPLSTFLVNLGALGAGLGIGFTGVAIAISYLFVDVKTKKGMKIFTELEGLKMYINTAEKHRIEFHNDPKKYRGVFEKLLPYAIVFHLEKKWAKEFEDIYTEPPEWYSGDISTFNTMYLANSISSIDSGMTSIISAGGEGGSFDGSGFSSGGGFSGGGGGGGGGGSW